MALQFVTPPQPGTDAAHLELLRPVLANYAQALAGYAGWGRR